jgi:membrane protein DedA with SNARE-associated domain
MALFSFLSQGDAPHLLHSYGYGAVAGVVALESIGLPLPGETTLIAAAIIAATRHELDIGLVIAAAAAGAIIGDNIGFWIGRAFGYRLVLRFGRYLRLTEPRIKLGQYLFERYGGWIVCLGRFVAVLRALAALLAGVNCMGWRRFLFFNALGAGLWAGAYGMGAYYLGKAMTRLAGPVGIAIGVVAAALIIAWFVFLRRHEAELEAKAEEAHPGPLRRPGRRR